MRGQGAFEPGEWTDDTAQMIAIGRVAADGIDLGTPEGEEAVARNLLEWYYSPARMKDIGIHTSAVFGRAATVEGPGLAIRFRAIAVAKERAQPGSSGGNGALMRTSPVAMALWREPERMVAAAMSIGGLTHADELSSQACAVWCLAIRAALLAADPSDIPALAAAIEADVDRYLPAYAGHWREVLAESFGTLPSDYYGRHPGNGYCVTTLRAAWGAVTSTPIADRDPARHLQHAIEAAVRGGHDTDTVACVTGALVGAMWGYSAVPLHWRRQVFGWPGLRDRGLIELADAIAHGRRRAGQWPHAEHVDYSGWPHRDSLAVHPHDDGVVLSGIDAATGRVEIPGGPVDAVVSLCRVGRTDLAPLGLSPANCVEVRLVDEGGAANPHLQLVMDEAADAVAAFRSEGKRVLLHCVAAQSRTPTVAALYSVRHRGVSAETALADVMDALPAARPNPALAASVRPA